ncbi:sporulation protein YunB [Thermoactinomyces mirandus]|uniref:Sporulation protein YunB n=1 Tax=Thermoactinomyces mirandus TaxID=2756294 RepID=A0A7W1XRF1_9BACL|nr:sporulation protein YunB [Thermoactinomyces mirandus]MBA4601787.1 sporulation protein YunB [Thermoactinomyces mirandus]
MSFRPRLGKRLYIWSKRRFKKPGRRPVHRQPSFRFPHPLFRTSSLVLVIFLIATLFLCYLGYSVITHQLRPAIVVLAEEEARKTAQKAFLKGIEEMQKKVKPVATLQVDKQDRIVGVSFNSQLESKAYQVVTERILKELNKEENREIHITLGEIMQSNIFADVGPEIPIQIWVEGTPHVTFSSSIEGKGINTTMITVNLEAEIKMRSLLPLTDEHYTLKFNQPVARQVIVGEVPNFYPFWLESRNPPESPE